MITYVSQDIFESDATALVIPTNCVGVLGKGLALKAKRRFPGFEEWYTTLHKANFLKIGLIYAFPTQEKQILIFPTKTDWRRPSEYVYIHRGLENFLNWARLWHLDSVAFPKLGCGEGRLIWDDGEGFGVKHIMETYLSLPNLDVRIHEWPETDTLSSICSGF